MALKPFYRNLTAFAIDDEALAMLARRGLVLLCNVSAGAVIFAP